MNPDLLDKDLIYNVGMTLLHSLWQITLIYLALLGLNRLLRKGTSRLRYRLNYISLILIFVFAGGTFLYYQNKDKESVLIVEKYGQAVSQPITSPSEVTETRAIPEKSVITTKQNLDENPWYLPYLVYAYFLGLFILGFRLLAGILYLKKLKTKGLRMLDTNMESRFLRLLDKFTMKRKVEIRESILTKVPMVLGYFKPLIIVPAGTFAHIPFNQMEAILAHELAHIQRNDFIQNIIQTLIELLFFYHPLVYLISSRIRKERENCCDDIALRHCENTADYVKALANLEELQIRISYPAVAFGHKKSHLLDRIKRILNQNTMKTKVSDRIFAGIIIVAGFATILLTGSATLSLGHERMGEDPSQQASINLKNTYGPEIVSDTIIDIDNGKITTQRKNKKGKEETVEMSFSEGRLSSVKVDDNEVPPGEYAAFKELIEVSLLEVRRASEEIARAEAELARVDMAEVERELDLARQEMESIDLESVRAEALTEIARARAEIEEAELERIEAEMRRVNMDSIQREVEKALEEVDMDSITREVQTALDEVDWEEINREISEAMKEVDYENEEVRRALEEAGIAMEEAMNIDIGAIVESSMAIAMESLKAIDMELIQESIEMALREAEIAIRELDLEMQETLRSSMDEETKDSVIRDIKKSKTQLKEEKQKLEKLEKDMEKALEELEGK